MIQHKTHVVPALVFSVLVLCAPALLSWTDARAQDPEAALVAATKEIPASVGGSIFGQTDLIAEVQRRLSIFFSRRVQEDPSFRTHTDGMIVLGLPGVGKSEIFEHAARFVGVPLIPLDLGVFAGDSGPEKADLYASAMQALANTLATLSAQKPPSARKCILLLKGLHHLEPQQHALADAISRLFKPDFEFNGEVFIAITGSVEPSIFNQYQDPRIGSFADLKEEWELLTRYPNTKISVLESMLPGSLVASLAPLTHWASPLDASAHQKMVERTMAFAVQEQSLGVQSVQVTPRYIQHLVSQAVIPIQGARQTIMKTKLAVEEDLRRIRDAGIPLTGMDLRVDFDRKSHELKVFSKDPKVRRWRDPVGIAAQSTYSSLAQKTGPLSEDRLEITIHEFGHALAAAMTGLRFKATFVESPVTDFAGVVFKRTYWQSGYNFVADIVVSLGSRAMERIFLAEDPLAHNASMAIPPGSVVDIEMATETLHRMIYRLGYEHRTGVAAFTQIPHREQKAMSRILQDLEDAIVREFLRQRSLEWYRDRILELARRGSMTEAQFYRLIDLPAPPADLGIETSGHSALLRHFGEDMVVKATEAELSRFRFGHEKRSPSEILRSFTSLFHASVQKHLHGGVACEHNMTPSAPTDRAEPASGDAGPP